MQSNLPSAGTCWDRRASGLGAGMLLMAVSALIASAGCNPADENREQHDRAPNPGPDGGDGRLDPSGPNAPYADGPRAPVQQSDAGAARPLECGRRDKVDLLFMVDNSHSMFDLQTALESQLPRLIHVLASGRFDAASEDLDFEPVRDLHLGVVSSDMGLGYITNIPMCGLGPRSRTDDPRGDDGRLISETRQPHPDCEPDFGPPPFLQFGQTDDPDEMARRFGCVAKLGADGCGLEQQLEAVLKALAPPGLMADVLGDAPDFASNEPDAEEEVAFVGTNASEYGHGGPDGANAGFLREDSLLAVVMLTDEEDCSSWNLSHFHHPQDLSGRTDVNPPEFLEDGTPHPHRNALNLRCYYNKQNLFPVKRYINGLKALRPGAEERVVFAAIAGVPLDLVEAQPADWTDAAARETWYEMAVADARMVEQVDEESEPLNLRPSCMTLSGDQGVAYPPLRIVNTARGFGAQGVVQSICQDDFAPALDAIIRAMATQLKPCLQ